MPGAGKQPPAVQEQIRELLEAGFDPTTIHRRLKVGRSSIYRMKRCLQQHGTAYMPPELNKKNGRPKVLSAEQELVRRVVIHVACLESHLLTHPNPARKFETGYAMKRIGIVISTISSG